ncbi:Transcriptional regulatory protein, C terminal [Nonomuraea solani]|uniref:Transcriptional regulatory protein, C terminal n=1 Tax=Nonomuraea solani TaxID=1144553 RepID=A0A1H6F019_9ACTN|nr:winged helix-turn-helix domain-containing protein [Nonomuraea solani]SEH02556.1 Transcriptional regulatory protein, C terminal [Nonomuraea solani]
MDIRVLGPVEVCEGGAQIPIEGAQQQCVLGLLAAYKGSYVPVDRLIEALWEDDPPKTAKTIVQLKVSQLRKTLGGRISSTTAGYSLAGAWFTLNEPRPAIRHCEQAAELYERIGWKTGVLVASSNLVVAGDLHEGAGQYEHIVRLWEAHDPSRLPALLENFAIKLMWVGLAGQALERQERAVRLREESDDPQPQGWRGRSYSILGDIHLALGDLDAAMDAFDRALEQAEGGELAAALSSAALVAQARGDGDGAADLARRAVAVAASGGMVREYEEARSTLAKVDASTAIGERIRVLRDVLDYYRDRTYPYIEVRARVWLIEVLLAGGLPDEAAELAREACAAAAAHGLRRLEGQALTLLARAEPPGAEHARRAAELHRAHGHRLDEAAARAALDHA